MSRNRERQAWALLGYPALSSDQGRPQVGKYLIILSILLLSITSSIRSENSTVSDPATIDVINRHFDAIGGKEAVQATTSLILSGQLRAAKEHFATPLRLEWGRTNQVRMEYTFNGRKSTNCYDGHRGWIESHGSQAADGKDLPPIIQTMGQDQLDDMLISSDWMISPLRCHLERSCRIKLVSKPPVTDYFELELTYESGAIDSIHLDSSTYLIRSGKRFLPRSGGVTLSSRSWDYREVEGLRLAFRSGGLNSTKENKKSKESTIASNIDAPLTFEVSTIESNRRIRECRFAEPHVIVTKNKERTVIPKIRNLSEQYDIADDEARIGLQISNAAAHGRAAWVYKGSKIYPVAIDYEKVLVESFSAAFCRLFPRCYVNGPLLDSANHDFVVKLDYSSDVAILYSPMATRLESFSLSGALSVFDREGTRVDVVHAWHTARLGRSEDYSRPDEKVAQVMAVQALEQVLPDLLDGLRDSSPFRMQLALLSELRQKPPRLATAPVFDDTGAFFPNGRLDAGETASIAVTVTNQGPGPALGVTVHIDVGSEAVVVGQNWNIGDLSPGQRHEFLVPVVAGLDVPTRTLQFRIAAVDKRGYGSQTVQLEIQGAELRLPGLAIGDFLINDRIGRAQGDGDGTPANGETVEVTLRVENRGQGDAVGVILDLIDSRVEVLEPPGKIGRIPAGDSREAVALLRIPAGYAADDLTLRVVAQDQRGAQVGRAEAVETWPLMRKEPLLAVEHRLYDGTSPGSSGDGDGVANNGEKVELGIVVTNRGNLMARNVQLRVSADHRDLEVSSGLITLGDLPAGSHAPEQRVPLLIPRWLGTEADLDRLTFHVDFRQIDFPSSKVSAAIAFEARRPALKVNANVPKAIARGSDGPLIIQIWNEGDLDAEGVTVEVETSVAGIELYEEVRGLPGQRHNFTIGSLRARDRPVNVRLRALARQETALASETIYVRVRQQGFAPVETEVPLRIEDRVVVVPVQPQDLTPPPPSTSGVAPSIAFLGDLKTGQQVKLESLKLRFEIQTTAGTELSRVHLEHRTEDGQRDIALGAPATRESHAGRTVETYEVPVEVAFGPNHFKVTATTEGGHLGMRTLSLNRIPDQGRQWVVAIGVGKYDKNEAIRGLAYARQDGQGIYDYYRSAFQVPDEQSFLLLDEQATRRRVMELLGETLPRLANNPEDTVIVYFAGHGMAESDPGSANADGLSKYLVPWDADPDHLFSTGINMEVVGRILTRISAERVIVIADTCFSGAAGGRTVELGESVARRSSLTDDFLERLGSGQGRVILAASEADKVAEERSALGHGVFTYYLLQGLEGHADSDCNGMVTLDELYRYTYHHVSQETGGKQRPVLRHSDPQIGEIIVGRSRQLCSPNE